MNYEEQVIATVKKVLPAVVSIVVSKDLEKLEASNPFGYLHFEGDDEEISQEEMRERIDSLPRTKEGKIKIGGGSGFAVDAGGIIVTNKHVVMDKAADYTVVTATEDQYPAEVLARDPINDVAILKINAHDLPVLELGDSNKIELGQTVVAVGTALGEFPNTVSRGIVSGLSRFITAVTDMEGHQERLRGLIQTDAAINPGNSGGPLVNLQGQVVAINSAVVFGAQNIGFAIPINKAKADLEDLKKYGKIRKPFLGIRYVIINKQLQEKFRLPVVAGALILKEQGPQGYGIVPGGAAQSAGLKNFDIILEFNHSAVTEKTTLEDLLERVHIGDEVPVKILRNNQEHVAHIRIGER
ncbi:trypsin-like peptidase domain-containing protein [Patescibacteria group bacterium]|nr:trypsin-like peptidase domain-containing protein [Patescibacteria group bacterium]